MEILKILTLKGECVCFKKTLLKNDFKSESHKKKGCSRLLYCLGFGFVSQKKCCYSLSVTWFTFLTTSAYCQAWQTHIVTGGFLDPTAVKLLNNPCHSFCRDRKMSLLRCCCVYHILRSYG